MRIESISEYSLKWNSSETSPSNMLNEVLVKTKYGYVQCGIEAQFELKKINDIQKVKW